MNKKKKDKENEIDLERKPLVDFFALLLKIDMRVNPHLYEDKSNDKQDE